MSAKLCALCAKPRSHHSKKRPGYINRHKFTLVRPKAPK